MKDKEGFMVTKCRWNSCRKGQGPCYHGVNGPLIRMIGGINAVEHKGETFERKETGKSLGDIMPIGTGERSWFREVHDGYEIDLTIDSGAVATIAPVNTVPGEVPRETEASRRKLAYVVANGASIYNKGELTLRGKAENGTRMNVIAQASDVTKPLAAAREIIKAGNRIVLDEEGSYIENKSTRKRIPIKREHGMFTVTMKLEKGNRREHERQYAVMGTEDEPSFHRQVTSLI